MKTNNEKILVTGGAGYVGSVVVRELLRLGFRVRIIDNLMYGESSLSDILNQDNLDFHKGDFTLNEDLLPALSGIDSIIHLAAIVGDPACSRMPDLAVKINLEGTKSLVNQAKENGVKQFIFSSTCSNYGISDPKSYADEESSLNPISPYSRTKVEAEKYILDSTTDLFSPTILRFATIYGISPRMRFDLLVNDFTKEAYARRKIVIYGEQFWRPYIHVRDIAKAIIVVLNAPLDKMKNEVFNVGKTSENYQKLSIANMVKSQARDTVLQLIKRVSDSRDYRVSFEKIKEHLDFSPDLTVEGGISEVFNLLKSKVIMNYDSPEYIN